MLFSMLRSLLGNSAGPPVGAKEKWAAALAKDRIVTLLLPINEASANEVMAKLLFLEMESPMKTMHLYINSPGGSVVDGLAIMDAMDKIQAPISTVCLGTAHSMAAVVLAHGRAGLRMAVESATITFTMPRGPLEADEREESEVARFADILIDKTARAARRPYAEIRTLFERETQISVSEAKALGLIDHVIAPR